MGTWPPLGHETALQQEVHKGTTEVTKMESRCPDDDAVMKGLLSKVMHLWARPTAVGQLPCQAHSSGSRPVRPAPAGGGCQS